MASSLNMALAQVLPGARKVSAVAEFRLFIKTVQCGWMPCVACSDTYHSLNRGRMWLGKEGPWGKDIYVTCPVCQGTCEVPKIKHIDTRTGQEIDYERFGKE